jgi:hypothetical protein
MSKKKQPKKEQEQEQPQVNMTEAANKVRAVGRASAGLFKGLWEMHAADIQRKLVECIEEAQATGGKVKFKVPVSVVMDLEKDEVRLTLGYSGPKKKRGALLVLSEIEPLLPGMEEEP